MQVHWSVWKNTTGNPLKHIQANLVLSSVPLATILGSESILQQLTAKTLMWNNKSSARRRLPVLKDKIICPDQVSVPQTHSIPHLFSVSRVTEFLSGYTDWENKTQILRRRKKKIKEAEHSLFKMVILQNRPKLKLTSQSSRRKEELFPLKKYIIKKWPTKTYP